MAISTSSSHLQYAVDEKPPHWLSAALGAQHVLFMLSGVLFIPVLLAKTGLAKPEQVEYLVFVTILVCSVTSIIQVLRVGGVIGSGYVLFMGTSGAFLGCTLDAIDKGGLALAATLAMLAAPLEFLISYFFRFLRKIFTPAVGGVVIMLVAVTIIPITLGLWVGQPGTPGAGSTDNLFIGLATFLTIVGCSIFGGRMLRAWSPVLGLVVGYLAAAALGQLDLANFQAARWFGLPRAGWPGIEFDLKAEHWPLFIAFAIATISGTIETVGDAVAAQKISRRDFRKVDYGAVQGALYADGVGNFLSGLVGTTPNTTYSSNIALMELNGVASRRVGLYGAVFLGLLAFFPKVPAFVIDIPGPALGAATFILMGMLFVTGIKVAIMDGVNPETVLVMSTAFWGGYAAENELFFPDLIPQSLRSLFGNGIATGSAIALLLAALFRLKPRSRAAEKLPADLANLPRLQRFLDSLKERFRLPQKPLHNLNLCCEEVFAHLCSAKAPEGTERMVLFRAILEEDTILVEITDRSLAEDVDLPQLPADLETASPQDLQHLGLFLVSRLAHEVSHVRISGYNYISFRISRG